MPKPKPHGPDARIRRRIGADAAFAKAMARSEFGRFYSDDSEQREIRRSMARGGASRKAPCETLPRSRKSDGKPQEPTMPVKKQQAPWRPPSVRERRTELEEAFARLRKPR